MTTVEEFEESISAFQGQTPALWRLSNKPFVEALRDFTTTNDEEDEDDEKLLEKAQELFNKLNPLMAQQERDNYHFAPSFVSNSSREDEFSVVFGGKYTNKVVPESISETLVKDYLKDSCCIYTVSRSRLSCKLPENMKHFPKENLDSERLGKKEFLEVLNMARCEWQESYPDTTLVIYFALGSHSGGGAFKRNLIFVENFTKALIESLESVKNASWRVVVTGTDATLPSTHKNNEVKFVLDGDDSKEVNITIPSYKISEGNYFYAMSKLGQYYIVASAVAQLLNQKEICEELKPTVMKIRNEIFIDDLTKSQLLNGFRDCKSTGQLNSATKSLRRCSLPVRIPGERKLDRIKYEIPWLNKVSESFTLYEKSLKSHFWIAGGISICFTPLHGKPWTSEAIFDDHPRLYILKQILWRLKNVISTQQAAALHFPCD